MAVACNKTVAMKLPPAIPGMLPGQKASRQREGQLGIPIGGNKHFGGERN